MIRRRLDATDARCRMQMQTQTITQMQEKTLC